MLADGFLVQAIEQRVQLGKRIAVIGRTQVEGEIADRVVRLGQGRVAEEQARRESLERATHDAFGILRFDLALDIDAQFGERPVGGEDLGEVAEGVFMRIARVVRDVDAPADHVLAFVIARGEPQDLDHAGGRRFVAMNDAMGDAQTHGSEMAIGGSDRSLWEMTPVGKDRRSGRPLSRGSCIGAGDFAVAAPTSGIAARSRCRAGYCPRRRRR